MSPAIPMVISASIIALLGLGHLVLTFRGPKLTPRDPDVRAGMQRVHLVITTETTVWRAWIGFNASHSLGAMLFGLVYGYLALAHGDLLFESMVLQAIGLAMLVSFVLLARAYWFITPLAGISVSLISYLLSLVLAWA